MPWQEPACADDKLSILTVQLQSTNLDLFSHTAPVHHAPGLAADAIGCPARPGAMVYLLTAHVRLGAAGGGLREKQSVTMRLCTPAPASAPAGGRGSSDFLICVRCCIKSDNAACARGAGRRCALRNQ